MSQGYGGSSSTMVRKRAAQDSIPAIESNFTHAEQHTISRGDNAIANDEKSDIAESTDSDVAIHPSLRQGSFDTEGVGGDSEDQDDVIAVDSDLENSTGSAGKKKKAKAMKAMKAMKAKKRKGGPTRYYGYGYGRYYR